MRRFILRSIIFNLTSHEKDHSEKSHCEKGDDSCEQPVSAEKQKPESDSSGAYSNGSKRLFFDATDRILGPGVKGQQNLYITRALVFIDLQESELRTELSTFSHIPVFSLPYSATFKPEGIHLSLSMY